MGNECKRDITKHSRRNWKEKYDEEMQKQHKEKVDWVEDLVDEVHVESVKVCPDDAQGGMLEYAFVDLVYCNCMRIGESIDGFNHVTIGSIEEYMACEQHRLNLAHQMYDEDMRVEKKYYGDLVFTERSTNNMKAKYGIHV